MKRLLLFSMFATMPLWPWMGIQSRVLWHSPTKPLPHAAVVMMRPPITLPMGCAPSPIQTTLQLYTSNDVYAGRFIATPAPDIE